MNIIINNIIKFAEDVESFLVQENNPSVGAGHNLGEGLGILLMGNASFAISWYKQDCPDDDMVARGFRKIAAVFIGVITSPITFCGAALKGIFGLVPHSNQIRTDAIIPRTDADQIDQIYGLLKSIHEGSKRVGLPYVRVSGTELGHKRHGGVIPWDDDGDLAVMIENEGKIEDLKKCLEQEGIELTYNPVFKMYQAQYSDEKLCEDYAEAKAKANVDLFIFQNVGDNKVSFASDSMRANFPREYFLEEELEETVEEPFGPADKGLVLNGIKNSENYLKRYYGQDCLDYGITTHNHFMLFGIPVSIPVLQTEKVQIVDHNCAQGRKWTGSSAR